MKSAVRADTGGISTIDRKLFYNPDGHNRPDEWDFLSYFEGADEQMGMLDRAHRGVRVNSEWRDLVNGPEWRGLRVLRW